MFAEEGVPQTIKKSNKTEMLFDAQLAVANAQPAFQLVSRGAPSSSVIPDYAQTEQRTCMRLLPVMQAGMMRPLSAEQALAAAASGSRTAIARTEFGPHTQW